MIIPRDLTFVCDFCGAKTTATIDDDVTLPPRWSRLSLSDDEVDESYAICHQCSIVISIAIAQVAHQQKKLRS